MSYLGEPLLEAGEVTASDEEPHIIVARTNNNDGSISLRVTTSTTHPNGYTDVKVERFEVPDTMSAAVDEELGIIPNEYLSRVEYRVLPPGNIEEDFADDNTVYTHITQQKACDASTVRISNRRKRRCPDWKRVIFGSMLFVAAWVLTAALITDLAKESSLHSPEETSHFSTTATTAADKASILPETNSSRADADKNTTGFLHVDSYFAPVTISHLLGAQRKQYQLHLRGKLRI